MLRRIAAGTVAGLIATLPQSAVVWGFRKLGVYRSRPAPMQVTDRLTRRVTGKDPSSAVQVAQHFAIGGAGGTACGVTSATVRPGVLAGLVTGLAMWAASYSGLLPALRIMPVPKEDEQGRAVTMFVAHVVYGLSMGWLLDRLAPGE